MNHSLISKRIPQILAAIVLVAATAAFAFAQDAAPAAGQRSDGQIEMDVVQALDASQPLKNDLITAATIQGEVTLAGTVFDQASKDLAASIVTGVNGVTKVHNNLNIGNLQAAQADQLGPSPNSTADASAAPPPPDNQAAQAQSDQGPQPPPQAYPQQQPDQSGQAQPYPQQPPYPNQGQQQPPYQGQAQPYPPQYPQGNRPQYAPRQQAYNAPPPPPMPRYQPATGPVTIAPGTLIQLRTSEPVVSKHAKDGEPVQFTVISDVAVGGVLAIPRGATVHGVVSEVHKAGAVSGSPELGLTLTSLDLGGQNYPLSTDQFKVKGPSKTGHTVDNAIGGGLIGTIIGCAVGRGVGCAIGAGAGVAGGVAASAASPGPGVWIPAEARVDFHLAAPVTVQPVSQQEAVRLAQGLYPGGPTLYRRGPNPYYYGRPVAYPYYYAYPPVYYHPYYMVGGAYYWR